MTTENNTITTLRAELFSTLRAIRDPKNPLPTEAARAVVQVAAVIIDSARVEVEFCKATGVDMASGFIPANHTPSNNPPESLPEPPPSTTVEAVPGGRIITHKLRG